MSKNRNYQGKRVDVKPVDEMIPETIKEEIEEVIEVVDEKVEEVEVVEEAIVTIEPTIGEVANCDKLYVRKGPSKEDEPVRIIDKGYKVEIDNLVEVPNGWLKVRFIDEYVDGGYCMEKYIKVIN